MLYVTAYKKLEVVEKPVRDQAGALVEVDNQWQPGEGLEVSEKCYPGRGEGLDADTVYAYSEGDRFTFVAGSSTDTYVDWRHLLADFKGEVAFQELLQFLDDDGVIGTIVATKLFNDFKTHLADTEPFVQQLNATEEGDGDRWLESYKQWTKAFEYASQNGAVHFESYR